jgi:hypothetical protein
VANRQRFTEPVTINHMLTMLRGTLGKAIEWELIDSSPLGKVKNLKCIDEKRVRFLSNAGETHHGIHYRKGIQSNQTPDSVCCGQVNLATL